MAERAKVERQPIASAPRDGTRVRLFHDEDLQDSDDCPVFGAWMDGDGWRASAGFVFQRGKQLYLTFNPTHWAPLTATRAEAS